MSLIRNVTTEHAILSPRICQRQDETLVQVIIPSVSGIASSVQFLASYSYSSEMNPPRPSQIRRELYHLLHIVRVSRRVLPDWNGKRPARLEPKIASIVGHDTRESSCYLCPSITYRHRCVSLSLLLFSLCAIHGITVRNEKLLGTSQVISSLMECCTFKYIA